MNRENSPTLKRVRKFKETELTGLYHNLDEDNKLRFRTMFNCGIENLPYEKFEDAIIECELMADKQAESVRNLPKQEFTRIGFFDRDYLSTCIVEGGNGTLWVFNHGSYSKIRRDLGSFINNDREYSEIQDWMVDTLHDYGFDINPTINSIGSADKIECPSSYIMGLNQNEIAPECIKINFTY